LDGKPAILLRLPAEPKEKFLSTAEVAALDDAPAWYRIGRPICSDKIEFSFLNGILMVPPARRLNFNCVEAILGGMNTPTSLAGANIR
jgi:hypothetical protein